MRRLLFILLALLPISLAVTPFSSCTNLTTPGETFLLSSSFTIDSATNATCIRLEANNSVIDCQGNTITMNGDAAQMSTTGIEIIRAKTGGNLNTTIQNCRLIGSASGVLGAPGSFGVIDMYDVQNLTVINTEIIMNDTTTGVAGADLYGILSYRSTGNAKYTWVNISNVSISGANMRTDADSQGVWISYTAAEQHFFINNSAIIGMDAALQTNAGTPSVAYGSIENTFICSNNNDFVLGAGSFTNSTKDLITNSALFENRSACPTAFSTVNTWDKLKSLQGLDNNIMGSVTWNVSNMTMKAHNYAVTGNNAYTSASIPSVPCSSSACALNWSISSNYSTFYQINLTAVLHSFNIEKNGYVHKVYPNIQPMPSSANYPYNTSAPIVLYRFNFCSSGESCGDCGTTACLKGILNFTYKELTNATPINATQSMEVTITAPNSMTKNFAGALAPSHQYWVYPNFTNATFATSEAYTASDYAGLAAFLASASRNTQLNMTRYFTSLGSYNYIRIYVYQSGSASPLQSYQVIARYYDLANGTTREAGYGITNAAGFTGMYLDVSSSSRYDFAVYDTGGTLVYSDGVYDVITCGSTGCEKIIYVTTASSGGTTPPNYQTYCEVLNNKIKCSVTSFGYAWTLLNLTAYNMTADGDVGTVTLCSNQQSFGSGYIECPISITQTYYGRLVGFYDGVNKTLYVVTNNPNIITSYGKDMELIFVFVTIAIACVYLYNTYLSLIAVICTIVIGIFTGILSGSALGWLVMLGLFIVVTMALKRSRG